MSKSLLINHRPLAYTPLIEGATIPVSNLLTELLRKIFFQFVEWGTRDYRAIAMTCRLWRVIINQHPAMGVINLVNRLKIDPFCPVASEEKIGTYGLLSQHDLLRLHRMNISLRPLLFRNLDLLMVNELKKQIMSLKFQEDLSIALFTHDPEIKKRNRNYLKFLALLEKDPSQWSKADVDIIDWASLSDGQILDIGKTFEPGRSISSLVLKLEEKLSQIPSDFENQEFVLALFRFFKRKTHFKRHQLEFYPNASEVVRIIKEKSEDLVLKIVSQSPEVLRFLPEFKTVFKVVLAAVKTDGRALEFGSIPLQDDDTIVEAAVRQDGRALRFASDRQRNSEWIVLIAVNQNGFALQYASDTLRANKKVVLTAAQQIVDALQYASPLLSITVEMISIAGQQDTRRCCALSFTSPEQRSNKEFVLAAVQENGLSLQYASQELRADKEVVLAALLKNGCALEYASEELRADKEVVLAALLKNSYALIYASQELRADNEVVLAALLKNGSILRYASQELRADKEVVLAAVRKYGFALQCASQELRADKEVVSAAVLHSGTALEFASEELRADKEVVLAAVLHNGSALEFASEELRADKEVVLAAVRKYGSGLEFATAELKAEQEIVFTSAQKCIQTLKKISPIPDKKVMLILVKYNGLALMYASPELRSDDEIVIEAMRENMLAWEFAYPDIRGELRKEKFITCLSLLKRFSYVDEEGSNLEDYSSIWKKH